MPAGFSRRNRYSCFQNSAGSQSFPNERRLTDTVAMNSPVYILVNTSSDRIVRFPETASLVGLFPLLIRFHTTCTYK